VFHECGYLLRNRPVFDSRFVQSSGLAAGLLSVESPAHAKDCIWTATSHMNSKVPMLGNSAGYDIVLRVTLGFRFTLSRDEEAAYESHMNPEPGFQSDLGNSADAD